MKSVDICARNSQLKKSRRAKVEDYYNVLQFVFNNFLSGLDGRQPFTYSQVLLSTKTISMLHLEKNSHQFMYVAHKCSLTHVDLWLKRCTGDCASSVKNNEASATPCYILKAE